MPQPSADPCGNIKKATNQMAERAAVISDRIQEIGIPENTEEIKELQRLRTQFRKLKDMFGFFSKIYELIGCGDKKKDLPTFPPDPLKTEGMP